MITIQNNKKQRRILILDRAFAVDESTDFTAEMFDAIFIYTISEEEAKSILNTLNPILSARCRYKPFLTTKVLEGKLGEYDNLIDYYTNDIDETDVLNKVEEILERNERLGLVSEESRPLSGNRFFIRLCRYLISRGITRIVPELYKESSLGYIIPITELFFRLGYFNLHEYLMFHQLMLEKGYFKVTGFINKVYLCPRCLRSHLLYIESCPRCHSSAIRSEEVIHHFRCANISPEHTYNFGGQLRCPKCHQLLRHIGVDYDRPSIVYTCANCDNNFLQPNMSAICTSCHHTAQVSELTPYDIVSYEVTADGEKAILTPDISFMLYADFHDNYMDYDRFTGRLRLQSEFAKGERNHNGISIGMVWILGNDAQTKPLKSDIISLLCVRFSTHKVSSANHIVYVKNTRHGDDDKGEGIGCNDEEFIKRIRAVLYQASASILTDEKICYAIKTVSEDQNVEQFIHELGYIPPFPDGEFFANNDIATESRIASYGRYEEEDIEPDGDAMFAAGAEAAEKMLHPLGEEIAEKEVAAKKERKGWKKRFKDWLYGKEEE